MKISNKIKNSIGLIIIVSLLIVPLLSAQKVAAQTNSFGASGSVSGSSAGSASVYIKGMAPVISALPGCFGRNTSIKNLYGGTNIGASLYEDASLTTGSTLDEQSLSDQLNYNSVPTYDEKSNTKLNTILRDTRTIKKSTYALDENQNCLNAIGKGIVKILIQKVTLSIVNWIQTGNQGNPLFPQNRSKLFNDIAKAEILGFGLDIKDAKLFPFGKDFMQNVAQSFNQKFQNNAAYSLNQLIQDTTPQYNALSFSSDFAAGGWGAWDAMTQVPANNPLGFQLMASQELGYRLSGTLQSPAQLVSSALYEGSGFLGDQRCVDPVGVSQQENDEALKGNTSTSFPNGAPRRCYQWEIVTPGGVIANQLTTAIGYNDHALLDAETLNDAIAAILDAVMAKFAAKLTTSGVTGIPTDSNAYDQFNNTGTANPPQKDFSEDLINSSSWLSQNPNFNIRTDLTQAIIDEQRTYVEKLQAQNKALPELIKEIHQLDYCIPGPHPGWEEEARIKLEEVKGKMINTTGMSYSQIQVSVNDNILAKLGDLGPVNGILDTFQGVDSLNEKIYREYIKNITGISVQENGDIKTYDQAIAFLDSFFDSYVKAVNTTYSLDVLPGVAGEESVEFNKLDGYTNLIETNTGKAAAMKGVISRLIQIKAAVDDLNQKLASGAISQDAYENSSGIRTWINAFGRISSKMMTGDDIAVVDKIYKEITDEIAYTKNDLLGGKSGCENNLTKLPANIVTYRKTYPHPLLNDYSGKGLGGFLSWGKPWQFSSFDALEKIVNNFDFSQLLGNTFEDKLEMY